jgi:N-methylhydantoinase A
MRTVFMVQGQVDTQVINTKFEQLAEELIERLVRDGAPRDEVKVERFLDCRYVGQGYELRIAVGDGDFSEERLEAFHVRHEAEYGRASNDPIEVVNLRVTATGQRPRLSRVDVGSGDLESAIIGDARSVWRVDGELVELPTRHLLRELLPLDEAVAGPAIVFQRDTTIVVPPGWSALATAAGPLMLTIQNQTGEI